MKKRALGVSRLFIACMVACLPLLIGFVARAGDTRLVGSVVTESGEPISGASVWHLGSELERSCMSPETGSIDNLNFALWEAYREGKDKPSVPTGHSQKDGSIQLPIEEPYTGPHVLVVTKDGLAPGIYAYSVARPVRLTLRRGTNLKIQVLGSESDLAMEGAEVSLLPLTVCAAIMRSIPGMFMHTSITGPDGQVSMKNVLEGVYAMRVVASGRTVKTMWPIVVRGESVTLRVRVAKGKTLKVHLTGAEPNRRGSTVVTAYWNLPNGHMDWSIAQGASSAREVLLDGIPSTGALRITGRAGAGEAGSLAIPEIQSVVADKAVTLQLRHPRKVRGKASGGHSGTEIWVLFREEGRTFGQQVVTARIPIAEDGSFAIEQLPALARNVTLLSRQLGESRVDLDSFSDDEGLGPLEFTKGSVMEGRALWEDGTPIENAAIYEMTANFSSCSTTAADGAFVCFSTRQPRGKTSFRARIDETTFDLVPASSPASASYIARPSPEKQFRVVDESERNPVQYLRIDVGQQLQNGGELKAGNSLTTFVIARDGHLAMSASTPKDAEVKLSRAEGGRNLDVTSALREESSKDRIPAKLPDEVNIVGNVLSAADSTPLTNAEVEVRPEENPDAYQVARVVPTDAKGMWSCRGLSEGVHVLAGVAPTYALSWQRMNLKSGLNGPIQLLLSQTGGVEGKVLGLGDGETATLLLLPQDEGIPGPEASTKNGAFSFENVKAGRYLLWLSVLTVDGKINNVRSTEVQVTGAESSYVEIDLLNGIGVFGQVFLGNEKARNAEVILETAGEQGSQRKVTRVRTDADGKYSSQVPVSGAYRGKLLTNAATTVMGTSIHLTIATRQMQEIDLHFPAGTVNGKVRDVGGNPLAKADVSLWRLHEEGRLPPGSAPGTLLVYRLQAEDNGSFQFLGLSEGEYILYAKLKGYADSKISPVKLVGDSITSDVVMRSTEGLKVEVVGPGGGALSGSTVIAVPGTQLDIGGIPPSAKTDKDGEANLQGVGPGIWSLVALYPGLAPGIKDNIEISQETAPSPSSVQLPPGGVLMIEILSRDGNPQGDIRPTILENGARNVSWVYENLGVISGHSVATGSDGRLTIQGIRAGEYSISATDSSNHKTGSELIQIQEGKESRVMLVFE